MNKFTIKQWRQLNDCTQQQLAIAIGVTRLTIINWESGKHRIDKNKLGEIAEFFNISVNQIAH